MSMLARVAAMGAGAAEQTYVDDVFSAYTYTGTGASQTITNGIDLAGKGGLVWIKDRGDAATYHALFDTERGVNARMYSSETDPNASAANTLTAFNSNGFSLGTNANQNTTSHNLISWTFRKAAKFFDIVTYTGNGSNRTISHNLGQVPGMIIVKRMDTTGSWMVYHRSLANTENLVLNTTAAKATNATAWNSTTATTSVFSLGTHADVNTNGGTYVAYLFAHDTATDGLVQCGSYTGTGGGQSLLANLGWEPQFIFTKCTTQAGDWVITDVMRGNPAGAQGAGLFPNASSAEGLSGYPYPSATGITSGYQASQSVTNQTYIYLAIRRPNKPPTSGTQVYNAIARTGTGAAATVTGVGFAPDLTLLKHRDGATAYNGQVYDRLRGGTKQLYADTTAAESTELNGLTAFGMDGTSLGPGNELNASGLNFVNWFFKRAPGVFDVVCYTGTGVARTVSHGLGSEPEMMIVKSRTGVRSWIVYHQSRGNNWFGILEDPLSGSGSTAVWNDTTPTSSVFTVGTGGINVNTENYVAYLFASRAGISKVGSYTGNGSSLTINCGFTTGARFILIKRTSANGAWFVWDTSRGIVAGNDPHLSLNTTAAEVTTDDSIDPASSGFIVNQVAATDINVNNATYVYLAFA